eukprot:1157763-Pelagomonas_calceolata.AAC.3
MVGQFCVPVPTPCAAHTCDAWHMGDLCAAPTLQLLINWQTEWANTVRQRVPFKLVEASLETLHRFSGILGQWIETTSGKRPGKGKAPGMRYGVRMLSSEVKMPHVYQTSRKGS